jgi:hypothetical protein
MLVNTTRQATKVPRRKKKMAMSTSGSAAK